MNRARGRAASVHRRFMEAGASRRELRFAREMRRGGDGAMDQAALETTSVSPPQSGQFLGASILASTPFCEVETVFLFCAFFLHY